MRSSPRPVRPSPCSRRTRQAALVACTAVLLGVWGAGEEPPAAGFPRQYAEWLEKGAFREAEAWLNQQIVVPTEPITSPAAIEREILRRTRLEFSLGEEALLAELRREIPDVAEADLARWRSAGELQYRVIDGERRYFRRAVANLFRFSSEARGRRANPPEPASVFPLTDHIASLVETLADNPAAEVSPLRHRIHYRVVIHAKHPRLKPGAIARAWLPYPQEYGSQRNVRLILSSPPRGTIAPNGSPHRSIYLEKQVVRLEDEVAFEVVVEFDSRAHVRADSTPPRTPENVQPHDRESELFRRYTSERPPHIVFSPEVRALVSQIVGDESNPLERARRIFHWVSAHIPWCSEMEYGIIRNLAAKGIQERRGDCGVQGMVFITLCRAAGVPARWQSGWQLFPGDWNMHDWSEIHLEPWGWIPVDASYGVRSHSDPRVRDFLLGQMDGYRMIVNLDYGRPLNPPKQSFRSEPNDFQRGEVEIDGHNLYFDEWDWTFDVKSSPIPGSAVE